MNSGKVRRTFWKNNIFAGIANIFNKGGPMKISEIMTPNPIWIDGGLPIRLAKRTMSEKGIKHLPVLDEKKAVVGILSDRDIKLQQAVSDDPNFHENALVSDVCVKFPFCAPPDTPAYKVLKHMHRKRIGSVIIAKGGNLFGIFTSMDACRVLAELLEQE